MIEKIKEIRVLTGLGLKDSKDLMEHTGGDLDKAYDIFKEVKELSEYIALERQNYNVYPSEENVFRVFDLPFDDVKVVILGQDPYHQPNQAHGL